MAGLADAKYVNRNIGGKKWHLKDPTDFFIEGLSLPEDQPLPKEHFEFGEIIAAGTMGSGKSVVIKEDIAYIARDLWTERDPETGRIIYEPKHDEKGNVVYGEDERPIYEPRSKIDFFIADDIGGTIEALMKSDKPIKFVFFDDVIGKGKDARESMTRANIKGSQKFLIIRHLVQMGILKAGYIILALATQDLKAVESRIREHYGALILKSYVNGVEEFLEGSPNKDEIIERLRFLSYNAAWMHRNDYRKIGYAIDRMGRAYQVITDMIQERIAAGEEIEPIEWKRVEDGTTFKKHFDELSDFALAQLREHGKLSVSELKGAMLPKLNEMEAKYHFCEVSEAFFAPAIWRAKWIWKQELIEEEKELKKIEEQEQKEKDLLKRKQLYDVIEFTVELFKTFGKKDLGVSEVKGYISRYLRDFPEKYGSCEIDTSDYQEIVNQAQSHFNDYLYDLRSEVPSTEEEEKKAQARAEKLRKEKAALMKGSIDYIIGLLDKFKTVSLSHTELKGFISRYLEDQEYNRDEIEITTSDYSDIISQAKSYHKELELQRKLEKKKETEEKLQAFDLSHLSILELKALDLSHRDIAEIKDISPSTVSERYNKQKKEKLTLLKKFIESKGLPIELKIEG